MSRLRQKKPSVPLGAALLALTLAGIALGARWVTSAAGRAKEAYRQSLARQTAAAAPGVSDAAPAPQPEPPQPAQEEPVLQVDAEQTSIEPPAQLTLMALGDNLIHNCVYWSAELPGGGYDFTPFYEDIRPVAEGYDLACINQETILVKDAYNIGNYPYFGTPIQMADDLAAVGFDIVTHATNHSYDKGETGILDSASYWRENHPEVTVLGIHDSEEDAAVLRVVEKNGVRLALLNYTYGLNYGSPAKSWMVDEFSSYERVKTDLQRAAEAADFTVVFAHWGEEGQFSPNSYQKTWAQFLADNGADVIIGAHPHVLQPLEHLTAGDGRDVPVFYSLGNFLSHQTDWHNMLGGMASLTFEKDAQGVRISQCELKPTVNVILYSATNEWYFYRPMLLEDYTPELAAQHRFAECSVENLTALYGQITG